MNHLYQLEILREEIIIVNGIRFLQKSTQIGAYRLVKFPSFYICNSQKSFIAYSFIAFMARIKGFVRF